MAPATPTSAHAALRLAAALALDRGIVTDCLDVEDRPKDAIFIEAFEHSLAALAPKRRRGVLGGITGHMAESVVEVVLVDQGWTLVWDFIGPGFRGVDLLMLGPGEQRLFAIEVKGTLRPRRWPRLTRRELTQMDVGWLDKADNPAMTEWGRSSEDVYGAVALVNFHDLLYKVALTGDLRTWLPVESYDQLADVAWLDAPL